MKFPPTPPPELDRIQRQLAVALNRARARGWLPMLSEGDESNWKATMEPIHESPEYRELERLSERKP